MKRKLFIFLITLAIIITGCQTQIAESTSTPAVDAVVTYLNALVEKDDAALTVLSCADWEANALMELDAFQSVETSLEGLRCQQNEGGDDSARVTCQGKIVTSYSGEVQEYDLSWRTYNVMKLGRDWLVCGY